MPPHSHSLQEEGAIFISFKLVQEGVFQEEGWSLGRGRGGGFSSPGGGVCARHPSRHCRASSLAAVTAALLAPGQLPGSSGTRNLHDNLADLRAQVAANQRGIQLVNELIGQYGLGVVQAYMGHIQVRKGLAAPRLDPRTRLPLGGFQRPSGRSAPLRGPGRARSGLETPPASILKVGLIRCGWGQRFPSLSGRGEDIPPLPVLRGSETNTSRVQRKWVEWKGSGGPSAPLILWGQACPTLERAVSGCFL